MVLEARHLQELPETQAERGAMKTAEAILEKWGESGEKLVTWTQVTEDHIRDIQADARVEPLEVVRLFVDDCPTCLGTGRGQHDTVHAPCPELRCQRARALLTDAPAPTEPTEAEYEEIGNAAVDGLVAKHQRVIDSLQALTAAIHERANRPTALEIAERVREAVVCHLLDEIGGHVESGTAIMDAADSCYKMDLTPLLAEPGAADES